MVSQRFSSVSPKIIWFIVGASPLSDQTVSFFESRQTEEIYTNMKMVYLQYIDFLWKKVKSTQVRLAMKAEHYLRIHVGHSSFASKRI